MIVEKEHFEKMKRDVQVFDKTFHVALSYPNINPIDKICVGLEHVRAADDIRISYDFDRDGYKIEQASTFSWVSDDPNCGNMDWQEVAFIQAWARLIEDD